MKKFLVVYALLLAACGQESGTPASSSVTADEEVLIGSSTRLVVNPPTYDSVPLPDGLEWLTNNDDPILGSPDAKRGGTFTTYLTGFPLTLRLHGPDSNTGSFVSMKRAMFLSLIDIHPNTVDIIPSLATHWAFSEDGRTVYFKLNPDARWSDGVPVTADDYVFGREMRLSEHVLDPFGQNYFTNIITDVRKHDDHTISVVHATGKPPNELLMETAIGPEPRHFHKLDENWVTDYSWRVEPNTGPYQITAVEKGRYIEYTRIQDWWGDTLRYSQNRFNVEKIRINIIRDDNVAFEYFLRGELDSFMFAGSPARWHDRARGEPFDRGLIGRIEYHVDVPQSPRGLWLNMDDPILADQNVRYGLAHAINMDRALDVIFRGDYERLQHQWEGLYWGYTNPAIRVRDFDLRRADQHLDAAGWTERSSDGIRLKNGQRLSLRVSYGSDEHSPWLLVVREEARKAGIDLALQLLDPSAWGTQVQQKTYQLVYLTFGTNLTPSFWQGYHSDNAHTPQTNNITNTDDPEIDTLIDEFEEAADIETRLVLSHRIQELVHEVGGFIPSYKIPFVREAFWRWLRLPQHNGTRTSAALFDPFLSGLFWIDEGMRAETLDARQGSGSFPPIDIVDTTWQAD